MANGNIVKTGGRTEKDCEEGSWEEEVCWSGSVDRKNQLCDVDATMRELVSVKGRI